MNNKSNFLPSDRFVKYYGEDRLAKAMRNRLDKLSRQRVKQVNSDELIDEVRGLTKKQQVLVGEFVGLIKWLENREPSPEILDIAARRKPGRVMWLDRHEHPALREKSPPEFIREVYKDRIGRGFTQADVKAADRSLYMALHRWLQQPDPEIPGQKRRLPDDLDLPAQTRTAYRDDELAAIKESSWIPTSSLTDDERARRRAYEAARKRQQRAARLK